ncbi:hypothetical protein SDRG_06494 [Saprolegnia diclina VS20]|uniref:F-box domain-containing protein n=1 Tax=Saprolegnia diclina (strain VS20) TaxID=1156394 RepID=T0QNT6_SAPDV|nr:hypothetical protein SDRG_06494 [Saprolegnia diclina VS20]EQC36391.1 hypothetical protein SDRG_06494 [Saprolegnia diclina VS20]|eukprot:XP_008610497.1 hypothetical protein SDRG_06494 [Saprolegnia diclina VS20]
MAQRLCPSRPTVLDVDGVPVAILQYTSEANDVVSFVRALPLAMRTPALTVLLELLAMSRGAKHWPTPRLYSATYDEIDCIGAAISLFNSACINGFCLSKHWPASGDPAFRLPFCGFVAMWAAKMTSVDMSDLKYPTYRDEFCRMLARCTSLKRACIPTEVDLLEAVTSSAHSVAELSLAPPDNSENFPPRAVAALQRWLASGHVRRLKLAKFSGPTDAGLARALATSPTLASLCLSECNVVLDSIIAHGGVLTSITELDLTTNTGNLVPRLLPLLPLSKLRSLSLQCLDRMDLGNCLIPALPHLSALENLALDMVKLGDADVQLSSVPSALRTLKLDYVDVSASSLIALLDWASRSTHLESVAAMRSGCFGANHDSAVDTLTRCVQAGARRVQFVNCDIDTRGASALAKALRKTHASVPLELDLTKNPFRLGATQALLKALATCTNVSIQLPSACHSFVDGDQSYVAKAKAGGVTIELRGWEVFICSRTEATRA